MDKKNQDQTPCHEKDSDLHALVRSARNGSQDAFLELKSRYKPLLESQVVKHTLPDMTAQDAEDLRQEALVIFCNAVCNYNDSTEGVEFGLYAKICIENGLISFVRSYLRRKKKAVLPLESAGQQDAVEEDPLQALVDKENMAELVRVIRNSLSAYENRVWWLYVSGMSASDITKALGVKDHRSVSNAIYRIRKKLRSFLSER
ncbi:MAG: sigma-70 family RNA polymerase sigma factor [Clostridia bacterium]|nr:sigma-70 family RNA polymerase sigma factor [Clostridia bacterium]